MGQKKALFIEIVNKCLSMNGKNENAFEKLYENEFGRNLGISWMFFIRGVRLNPLMLW